MDVLFVEYSNPYDLLDGVISTGRFCDFLTTFEKKRKERQRWEFYIHKLPPWDDTTWEEFNKKLDKQEGVIPDVQKASKEQLEATIKDSYKIMQSFEIEKEGG
jgi:hypothetical protein